jgi:hypothetical protein
VCVCVYKVFRVFFVYKMLYPIQTKFSAFLIWRPFFLPNFLYRTSTTLLNSRGENGHPCFLSNLRENIFHS